MSELIGIREAARRLGVSDTAVHKAIKAGRVHIAQRDPKNDRPLVAWPAVQDDWNQNSDPSKRTHIGPRGGPNGPSPRRESYGGNAPAPAPLPSVAQADAAASVAASAPSLAQSRAVREAYQARLAKLEYEKAIGKVIEADAVKVQAFKLARQVRDGMLNLPDRLAAELAAEQDTARVHARLQNEIRDVLAALAAV